MEPQIRFTRTASGVRIAYMQLGEGRPVLRLRNASVSMQAELGFETSTLRLLAAAASVTTFDPAGTGASQREVSDHSLEARVQELEAVAACVADEHFILAAGGPDTLAAAAFASRHPGRVELLACFNPAPAAHDEWPLDFLQSNWSMSRRYMANWEYPDGPVEVQRRYSRAVAASIEQETLVRMSAASRAIDPAPMFAGVRVPTLIVQRIRDAAERERLQPILDALPACDLVLSDTRNGPAARREFAAALFRTAGIDAPAGAAPPVASHTLIILFADIVDSTALTERMGNAAFRERSTVLETRIREAVRAQGGEAVAGRTLGDGVLATFPSASQGIAAAIACSEAGDGLGLALHLGLHAGDVMREDGNVHGIAVNLASRVSALTGPNEILVSQTVRDLARASTGVTFEDRGEQALKGVGEPVRVFAVRKSEGS